MKHFHLRARYSLMAVYCIQQLVLRMRNIANTCARLSTLLEESTTRAWSVHASWYGRR